MRGLAKVKMPPAGAPGTLAPSEVESDGGGAPASVSRSGCAACGPRTSPTYEPLLFHRCRVGVLVAGRCEVCRRVLPRPALITSIPSTPVSPSPASIVVAVRSRLRSTPSMQDAPGGRCSSSSNPLQARHETVGPKSMWGSAKSDPACTMSARTSPLRRHTRCACVWAATWATLPLFH